MRTHAIRLALCEPAPAEAPVGSEVTATLRASCPEGCDLRGLPLTIAAPDGTAATYDLAQFADGMNETAPVALRIPGCVGTHSWAVSRPAHEDGAVRHPEATLSIAIAARPHPVSLAVWSIPQPLVAGERFALKVGVKSSGGCDLGGQAVEVCDPAGAVAARGVLGASPWPDTAALYWTEVPMTAPREPGLSSWSARFTGCATGLPHESAASTFSLSTVAAPEHSLTVTVIEKGTAAPVEDALVRLGDFRAATGPSGKAEVKLPKGCYNLVVWKAGYDAPPIAVEVQADAAVEVELLTVPEEDPDAAWRM